MPTATLWSEPASSAHGTLYLSVSDSLLNTRCFFWCSCCYVYMLMSFNVSCFWLGHVAALNVSHDIHDTWQISSICMQKDPLLGRCCRSQQSLHLNEATVPAGSSNKDLEASLKSAAATLRFCLWFRRTFLLTVEGLSCTRTERLCISISLYREWSHCFEFTATTIVLF